jgi:hypothetical protein
MTTDGGDERQGSSFGLAALAPPTRDRIVHHHRL